MNSNTHQWIQLAPELPKILEGIPSPYYPPRENVFRAFSYFPPSDTKVVILGQDPYHTEGKAWGLSFGYDPNYAGSINSSLKNVIEEVRRTEGREVVDITLESWAKQGVLLLNTRLTVAPDKPMSHAGMGWEDAVGRILLHLAWSEKPIVFMLWGREAREMFHHYTRLRDNPGKSKAIILEASHPCRYSAHISFVECGHFQMANEALESVGQKKIHWTRRYN